MGGFAGMLSTLLSVQDLRRIIQVYELIVVLAMALFLVRLPKSAGRLSIALLVLVLLAAERNPETFDSQRPIAVYQRWVAAPIAIDPACTSF